MSWEADEYEEDGDRIAELQEIISAAGRAQGLIMEPEGEDLVVTSGRLSVLLEFLQEWRSEVEELG